MSWVVYLKNEVSFILETNTMYIQTTMILFLIPYKILTTCVMYLCVCISRSEWLFVITLLCWVCRWFATGQWKTEMMNFYYNVTQYINKKIAVKWYIWQYIYRIMAVINVKIDIIIVIAANLIGRALILVKMVYTLSQVLQLVLSDLQGPSWSWSYVNWIYNYLCNQCQSPLKMWVRIKLTLFAFISNIIICLTS
jgi:hypothetical protein